MKKHFDDLIIKLSNGMPFNVDETLVNSLGYAPSLLYKYRSCDDNGFDMLEWGYIWASIPDGFIDPIDSKVNLRLRSELPAIHKWMDLHIGELIYYHIPPKGMQTKKGNHSLSDYLKAQEHFVNEKGRLDTKLMKKEMVLEMKRLPKEQQVAYKKMLERFKSREFEEAVVNGAKKVIDGVVNIFRKSKIVASLTCRRDNSTMWENYANKYTGFCVEYKVPALDELSEDQKSVLVHLLPVRYYKRIPGVSLLPFIQADFHKSLYGEQININDSVAALYKQLIYKRYEYNFEEEWRIILDEKVARKVDFPFVSAVYAGFRIADGDLQKLRNICNHMNIPLYCQKLSATANRFQYELIG